MPVYEYKCKVCGHVTPLVQKEMDGGPLSTDCEKCGCSAFKILSHVNHAKKKKGRP